MRTLHPQGGHLEQAAEAEAGQDVGEGQSFPRPKPAPQPRPMHGRGNRQEQEAEAVDEEAPGEAAPTTTLPDDEEIIRREEHDQRLRRAMGASNTMDGDEAALGFSSQLLDEIQNLWDPLTAGELLARLGHFLRIVSGGLHGGAYSTRTSACTGGRRG